MRKAAFEALRLVRTLFKQTNSRCEVLLELEDLRHVRG